MTSSGCDKGLPMKILYVEDQLSANIPRIIRLFSKYLKAKRVEALEAFEYDTSGYGAEPKNIQAILEETCCIEVDYRFPDALRKIIHHPDKYSLFIIDRNLVQGEYAFDEVKAIDPSYTEVLYERFFEREGDYLLQKLVYNGINVMSKFYFLTAYSAQSEVQQHGDEIQNHIDFGKFTVENFIEKGNEGDLKRLQQVLNNIKILDIQNEHAYYLNILRTHVDEEVTERLIKVLQEKDSHKNLTNSPNEIRIIYEKILRQCSKRIPHMKEHCFDNNNHLILGKQTIEWLFNNALITRILRNFFYSIKTITSVLSHANYENPTTDTINALVFMLKDMIVWFDGICQKYPK